MSCLHCGAEVNNGLGLCELCRRFADSTLDHLPIYIRNLARWRPGRAGSRPVPGSRVLYDGVERRPNSTGDRISDRLDEAMTALTTWARAFAEARGDMLTRPLTLTDAVLVDELAPEVADALRDDTAETGRLLCLGFERRLDSIATLDWSGEFVRDLARHEAILRGLTETLVPGWYAGACQRPIGFDDEGAVVRCGVGTYVVPGLTWVTCGACGGTTYAHDHLEVILDEAREWVARPKALAEAVVALVHSEQSIPRMYARIRQWAAREELTPIRRTERAHRYDMEAQRMVVTTRDTGHARYRFGDVLDLVFRSGRKSAASGRIGA